MDKIRLTETGYKDKPGIFIGFKTKHGAKFESVLFKDGYYLRLTKTHCKRLIKFLTNCIRK